MPQPFDSAICPNAQLATHISTEKIRAFVMVAQERGFPLHRDSAAAEVLIHLQLMRQCQLTNAAILLFSDHTQRFFPASQVQCFHFAGTKLDKPLATQTLQGSLFELTHQASYFVLSRINDTGTYEIPVDAMREAIVNAIAHRDYTAGGSVQVRLFSDRLEVYNPAALPPSFDPAQLRLSHASRPPNPLLAEPLYLATYRKSKGTGTTDIIALCREAGLPQPRFLMQNGFWAILPRRHRIETGGHTTPPAHAPSKPTPKPPKPPPDPSRLARTVLDLVRLLGKYGALGNAQIREHLGLKDRRNMQRRYTDPALDAGLIQLTIPDKPQSRSQQYRLTAKGKALYATLPKK